MNKQQLSENAAWRSDWCVFEKYLDNLKHAWHMDKEGKDLKVSKEEFLNELNKEVEMLMKEQENKKHYGVDFSYTKQKFTSQFNNMIDYFFHYLDKKSISWFKLETSTFKFNGEFYECMTRKVPIKDGIFKTFDDFLDEAGVSKNNTVFVDEVNIQYQDNQHHDSNEFVLIRYALV